ncbi:MAG TPA: hypothetical protein PLN86_10695 [Candidatus Hydrogenedentes bacterium]|nr:hypothetical protein [Candidatus Hydrogenedentota bacterium]
MTNATTGFEVVVEDELVWAFSGLDGAGLLPQPDTKSVARHRKNINLTNTRIVGFLSTTNLRKLLALLQRAFSKSHCIAAMSRIPVLGLL